MSNRRALITCVDTYMGPTIREKFEANGIEVFSSREPMRSQEDCEALIERAGQIDILIANLAEPPMTGLSMGSISSFFFLTTRTTSVNLILHVLKSSAVSKLMFLQRKIHFAGCFQALQVLHVFAPPHTSKDLIFSSTARYLRICQFRSCSRRC